MVAFGYRLALFLLAACACCWPSRAVSVQNLQCPDPSDCTAALQLALDAGGSLRLASPGPYITRMLHVTRSDVGIACDPGVILLAKRWQYNGTSDSLLTVSNTRNFVIEGCTLRMWREDYANPLWYKKGEWRMALRLLNVSAVTVSDCSFEESGGDGLYLGDTCNEDVVIRGSSFKGNYRQGMSVICCERLVVQDCSFEDTRGTNPQCGVDFEPNTSQQRLTNVSFVNNTFRNNTGCQIAISTYALTSNSTPISIFFQQTAASISDGYGIIISIPHAPAAGSHVTFLDTNISDSSKFGLFLMSKPPVPVLHFQNSVFANNSYGPHDNVAPLVAYPVYNVLWSDCLVVDDKDRRFFFMQAPRNGTGYELQGNFTVENPFARQRTPCEINGPDSVKFNVTCVEQ